MYPERKKKRVRPARKIIPRANMGIGWIIAPLVMATLIAAAGIWFLLIQS